MNYDENKMNPEEIERKLSENLEIPESLLPENVVKMLKENQKDNQKKNQKKKGFSLRTLTAMASVIAITIVSLGSMKVYNNYQINQKLDKLDKVQTQVEDKEIKKNEKLGSAYHLVSNYSEISDAIENQIKKTSHWGLSGGSKDLSMEEEGAVSDLAVNGGMEDAKEESSSYSETNLMTEGVDESDYVKLDGHYLYYLYKDKIFIVDTKNYYETVAVIPAHINKEEVDREGKTYYRSELFREMYVDGDSLTVIAQIYEERDQMEIMENGEEICIDYAFFGGNSIETVMYTYDISDRSNPIQVGFLSQEGEYHTSRKVGDFVYLFTNQGVNPDSKDFECEEVVPKVNGECIDAACIYLGDEVYFETVITSINMKEPEKVYDVMAMIGSYSEIYVGKEAIYLYHSVIDSAFLATVGGVSQEITKFSYKDGILNGECSTSVVGSITDKFAVNEYEGNLRVLTTDYSMDGISNNLYILDASLNMLGSITGIAENESIYAARFEGNRAYFVTYLNHDPVFVADLSDAANPVLLGNVEISGYSDYLHMYDDKLLLGLGYETDEKTSARLGFKVSMFDFSDEENPITIASEVIPFGGWGYSMDFDEYKNLLVDPKKNLIGFSGQIMEYDKEEEYTIYCLYSWNGESFENLATLNFEGTNSGIMRGVYVDQDFIVIRDNILTVYAMDQAFAEKAVVSL